MGDGTKRKKQIIKVITSGYILIYDNSMGILKIKRRK